MAIPSLLLLALIGASGDTGPEAVPGKAPLWVTDNAQALFLAMSRTYEQGWTLGVDLSRRQETVSLPIPPALLAGPGFQERFAPAYDAADLALDCALELAAGQGVGLGSPRVLGMNLHLLTDLSEGAFGLVLSRSF